jgi:hypothetical protein
VSDGNNRTKIAFLQRGRLAHLTAIDKLLVDRPEKIGHDFSEAKRRLTVWRNRCIGQWRETRTEVDRQHLGRLNAAVSVVVGGQLPLGSVNWGAIQRQTAPPGHRTGDGGSWVWTLLATGCVAGGSDDGRRRSGDHVMSGGMACGGDKSETTTSLGLIP